MIASESKIFRLPDPQMFALLECALLVVAFHHPTMQHRFLNRNLRCEQTSRYLLFWTHSIPV